MGSGITRISDFRMNYGAIRGHRHMCLMLNGAIGRTPWAEGWPHYRYLKPGSSGGAPPSDRGSTDPEYYRIQQQSV